MPLLPQSRALRVRRGESSVVGEYPAPRALRHPPPPPQLAVESSPAPDDVCLSGRYAQVAQGLMPSLPSTCHLLSPPDVKLVGEHPIAAGGFANIWEGTHGGRKVVLKSYRCYVSFDAAQVVARFCNEVHIWTLLHDRDVNVAPLLGVYSTETHPFGLVYVYMDGLDLRQYLRNEPNARKLELLARIAWGLDRTHGLGIAHGNIQTVNILADKDGTPRIASFGNTSILPHSAAWTAEGKTSTDRLSPTCTLELAPPVMAQNLTNRVHSTVADDMYAFGVMAWEVPTGRPPFSDMTEIAATYSMLNGTRPLRPGHRAISDRVWHMIESCWHNVPSKRMSAGEALTLLGEELGRTSGSRAMSRT